MKLFASHNWGKDAATHARVKAVVSSLKERGFSVWFDETHMKGNILDAMCKGIDGCDAVLVFVTAEYMQKVEAGDDHDNVRREFMYAVNGNKLLIPIRFDSKLPSQWSGPLGMVLGSHMYTDLSMCTPASVPSRPLEALVSTLVSHQKPALAPKRAPSSKSLPGPSVRERVEKAYLLLGNAPPPGDVHIGEAVNNLFRSIRGCKESQTLTFMQKLVWIEKELS